MPASIGVNLRVTGHCRQGGRKYMEDFFSVAYQQTEDEKDLEYAFFGIYDGHGGAEAAAFAKEHLMESIIKHKNFWSDYDEDVLRAIKDGYIATHYAMWKEQEKWPRTASGLPSTAGTTASVAFIRRGKIYIGHVGDSGITLGYQEAGCSEWRAKPLTRDHKPENADEMSRIEQCGGKVVAKSGVPRVVWNRPKIGHQGPVRRSTPIDEIPFLAVARSLGDLWSYNSQINQFIVSPDPDCSVLKIDTNVHRCLIFGTDGLYNMLSPMMAVHIVQQAERHNENAALSDSTYKTWLNPSKLLVERALERWYATKMRADNTSVVTLMLDPPGPPRAQVLKDRKKNLPERGLRIMTRFDGTSPQENSCNNNCDNARVDEPCENTAQTILENATEPVPAASPVPEPFLKTNNNNKEEKTDCATSGLEITPVSSSDLTSTLPLKERNFLPKPRESTSLDPREPLPRTSVSPDNGKENLKTTESSEDIIQCNEISSSNIEVDSTCEEEGVTDSTSRCGKPNLRSSKRAKNEVPLRSKTADDVSNRKHSEAAENVKGNKRKMEPELVVPQPRKSIRIDLINKKAVEAEEKERKSSKVEEKVAKQKKPKLSIAQKILKSKPVNLKKKLVAKKPFAKKKLQLVLDAVRNTAVSLPCKPAPKDPKQTVPNKTDKQAKRNQQNRIAKTKNRVMALKTSKLQRQADKNASQSMGRPKVVGRPKKDVPKEPVQKSNGKDVNKENVDKKSVVRAGTIPKKNAQLKSEAGKSSSNVLAKGTTKRTLRNSGGLSDPVGVAGNSGTLPETSKVGPKKGVSVKVKALRKRIQKKTESLRRNALRSKTK